MRLGVRLSCCCCTCAAACTPSTPLEHSWCARWGLTLLATLDVRFSGHPRNSSSDNVDGYFRCTRECQARQLSCGRSRLSTLLPDESLRAPELSATRAKVKVRISTLLLTVNCQIDIIYHICRSQKLYKYLKCNNSMDQNSRLF